MIHHTWIKTVCYNTKGLECKTKSAVVSQIEQLAVTLEVNTYAMMNDMYAYMGGIIKYLYNMMCGLCEWWG